MTVISIEFAVFTCAVLALYYALPPRPQNLLLLGASYLFLTAWDVNFAIAYAVLTAINYYLATQIAPKSPHRRAALSVGIAVNVAALGYFKYADFFIPELQDLLSDIGFSDSVVSLRVLLPVGLSFYCVQAIAYLLDLNQALAPPPRSAISFALFMAYFPRLTSGPIQRARDLIPQFEKARRVDNETLATGFTLMLLGLVRKVALADVLLSLVPTDVFDTPNLFGSPELALWLVVYAFALYNDFAGYTNIVRGVSLLFGIKLTQNFAMPYFARNFTEFWQRWHISLSNWLRDYIFMPLTRALLRRKYRSRHLFTIALPPLLTMLVSAIWHDISWHMLLWGGMHGVYQIVERVHALYTQSRAPDDDAAWRQVGSMLLVFVLVTLAWVPFRAEISATFDYWRGLFSVNDWLHPPDPELTTSLYVTILAIVCFSLTVDMLQYRRGELLFLAWSPWLKAIGINVALIALLLGIAAQGTAPPPFIYQGF